MLPSNHVVRDENAPLASLAHAELAQAGKLMTFGILPTVLNSDVRAVERFVERPDLSNVEGYLASGQYF